MFDHLFINKHQTIKFSKSYVLLISSIFLSTLFNFRFYKEFISIYNFEIGHLLSTFLIISSLIFFLLNLLTFKKLFKPILICVFMFSSIASYFMDTYSVVIDEVMLSNIIYTDSNESLDLLSLKMVLYILFLGVVPSICVYKLTLSKANLAFEFKNVLYNISVSFFVILVVFLPYSKFYSSFFREHKIIRSYVNPVFWMYGGIKSLVIFVSNPTHVFLEIGDDVKVVEDHEIDKLTELIILVVGETARSDHFSLNGYNRITNPLLGLRQDIYSFKNVTSCGTSTAVSAPCMFSMDSRDDFSADSKFKSNLLDILDKTKFVNILWRDNNSSSKGVADRLEYQDFRSNKTNTICDSECRDEGMIQDLDKYIKDHKGEDIFIVLHQMGSHGPAYYKRYPKDFEVFKPVCRTNELDRCSKEEIVNAYDNTILYTDYFLNKTINFLKKYNYTHEVAMVYVSDHGESLGERGIYLHGLPYALAPDAQVQVPLIFWFGNHIKSELNISLIKKNINSKYTHDNIFHTMLGLFETETKLYIPENDMLKRSKVERSKTSF